MPLSPTDRPPATSSRSVRILVGVVALAALLVAVTTALRSDDGPARNRVETAAREVEPASPRTSSRLPDHSTIPPKDGPEAPPNEAAQTPFLRAATSPARVKAPGGAVASPTARATPPRTQTNTVSFPSVTQPADTSQPGQPPVPTEPTGPTEPAGPTEPVGPPPPPPPPPPPSEIPPEPEGPPTGPTAEQQACKNLDLVAIGDPVVGNEVAEAATSRFRSAMPQIPGTSDLVCARWPIDRFLDDLVVQRVHVAGAPYGILVAGLEPTDPVLWLSEIEWASFKWRVSPGTTHNFTGVPVRRTTIGGHDVIRTSRGAVVMVRSDTWGHTVVGGAFDFWMASGGPSGPMGLPESRATGTDGVVGAYQEFTNGELTLPGVVVDFEAESLPASSYVWVPLTAAQVAIAPPAPNTIQDVHGVSYYVDGMGVRHWIETFPDWKCAANSLGATDVKKLEVGPGPYAPLPGWQAAKAPLGPKFVCPSGS